jgi:S1-C subfamily serine protease
MARELLLMLAEFYTSEEASERFVMQFGIRRIDIKPNQKPIDRWQNLLIDLAKKGTLRKAVEGAHEEFGDNPGAEFLKALLDDRPAPVSAQPRGKDGKPGFDDTVTTKEALLFFNDLTMPVGEVTNLIATLNKMVTVAPSICLLRVQGLASEFYGTGFRFSKDLILTNHHVLYPDDRAATKVQVDFDFDVDAGGASTKVTSLAADTATIKGEKADDWAVIKVESMHKDWPALRLDGAPAPKVGDFAFILQHPRGQKKRLGFVRNTISDVEDGVIRYLTDTQPGSSGSPVFDPQGRLIALHHAGGRPSQVAGKPPVAKNEGIRISRVIERLKAGNILQ